MLHSEDVRHSDFSGTMYEGANENIKYDNLRQFNPSFYNCLHTFWKKQRFSDPSKCNIYATAMYFLTTDAYAKCDSSKICHAVDQEWCTKRTSLTQQVFMNYTACVVYTLSAHTSAVCTCSVQHTCTCIYYVRLRCTMWEEAPVCCARTFCTVSELTSAMCLQCIHYKCT